MNINNILHRSLLQLSATLCASLLATTAQAALLNMTLANFPDIVSGFIDVSYDASTQAFSASGFSLELKISGNSPEQITNGNFNLDATIDNNGSLFGGTLTIGGTIASLGFNSGTLVTGTLTAFGFPDDGGDLLEFHFDVTSGDAASLYGPRGGIILGNSGFDGYFSADFDNLAAGITGTGFGATDTASIATPVPAALWLFGSGLLCLAGITRRRRAT